MTASRDSDRPQAAGGVADPWHPDSLDGRSSESAPSDPSPLEAPVEQPPLRVAPVVVPRWVQAVVLPLALIGLWELARATRTVVLVFLVAAVIALIINPLVSFLHRRRIPRGLAVLAVYLGFIAAMVGIGALLVSPVTTQVQHFQRDVPAIVKSANKSLGNLQTWLDQHHVGIKVQGQGQTVLQTVEKNVLHSSGSVVNFTTGLVQTIASAAFSVVLILVVSIYMLLYGNGIGRIVRRAMPRGDGTPEDDFPLRAQKAVSSYVRGQLTFSLVMGVSAGLALWVFGALGIFPDGQRFALFFGAFYAFMELIPYVGPILGALPPVLVALFEDPLTAVWVVLLFLALQQLEGHVVAPQVFGHSLRINPLLIILTLLIGNDLYGIVGALIALPIAAVIRETAIYLRRHLVLEPWGTLSPAGVAAARERGSPAAGAPPPPTPAPEPEADREQRLPSS